jgi:hypothetical protein
MTMPDELKLEKGWLKKATDEAAFNLRLIANAKEMLAALERLASPEAFDVPRMTNKEEQMRMEYARAAIAKARGQS